MSAREDWKELKPLIGGFIGKLDTLYKGCENIEEAIIKAENKGYKKGFDEGKKVACDECPKYQFYKKCNGSYETIKKFVELSYDSKYAIKRLIDQLYIMEQEKNNGKID